MKSVTAAVTEVREGADIERLEPTARHTQAARRPALLVCRHPGGQEVPHHSLNTRLLYQHVSNQVVSNNCNMIIKKFKSGF